MGAAMDHHLPLKKATTNRTKSSYHLLIHPDSKFGHKAFAPRATSMRISCGANIIIIPSQYWEAFFVIIYSILMIFVLFFRNNLRVLLRVRVFFTIQWFQSGIL
ncbi:hypothetical protein ACHAWT_004087 [Skeletonema menzelii]